MNNARIIIEDVNPKEVDHSALYKERLEQLTDIIEALQNIAESNYWKTLQKYVFNVDLSKAKRRLAKEKDTIEIFRLQGQLEWGEKFNLELLITKYRDELTTIRKKLQ